LLLAALDERGSAVEDQAGHRDDRDESEGKNDEDLAALLARPASPGPRRAGRVHGTTSLCIGTRNLDVGAGNERRRGDHREHRRQRGEGDRNGDLDVVASWASGRADRRVDYV